MGQTFQLAVPEGEAFVRDLQGTAGGRCTGAGKLLQLGIEISERTVLRLMPKDSQPRHRPGGLTLEIEG